MTPSGLTQDGLAVTWTALALATPTGAALESIPGTARTSVTDRTTPGGAR